MQMLHLLSKQKVLKVRKNLVIEDVINQIQAVVEYNPKFEEQKPFSSWAKNLFKSGGKSNKSERQAFMERNDYFKVTIYKKSCLGLKSEDENLEPLAHGDGSFLSHLQIDGKVYWELSDE